MVESSAQQAMKEFVAIASLVIIVVLALVVLYRYVYSRAQKRKIMNMEDFLSYMSAGDSFWSVALYEGKPYPVQGPCRILRIYSDNEGNWRIDIRYEERGTEYKERLLQNFIEDAGVIFIDRKDAEAYRRIMDKRHRKEIFLKWR
ncbi:MAG: hypothetical protein R3251_00810 [Candidatus Spechtbacterales bacterium]|nr:hypothetical protein [Candidatus Spechtbacterales bacterium]